MSPRGSAAEVVVITTEDLEPAVRLKAGFESAGFSVELLTSGESLDDVPGDPILLVLSGGLRERRARTLIESAQNRPRLPVLGLLESTESASRELCRQLGLAECVAKPVDVDEVVLVGSRLVQRERLRDMTGIIGATDVMEEVLERIVQIAPVDSTVLIQGESGTGKELVARGIHALSPRRHRPFIAVNVAALPENLLESELFGHEKGSFTGASSLRKGLFELAHQSTIFLDEIGEMPLSTQTKLLRVLEEQEFRRVGGEVLQRVDVRVIAATNRALREQVEMGEFRRDLYHRLNVLRIALPPLRERREDIPLLIDKFVRQFARQYERTFHGIDPEAFQILVDYAWPGNVRELRNLVESMVVLAPGRTIFPADIPDEVRGGGRGRSLLPVLARPPAPQTAGVNSPELEFVFRTLFDLKMDMDELRREFEVFRARQHPAPELPSFPPYSAPVAEYRPPRSEDAEEPATAPDAQEEGVVFRPGMTMEEMEREAIRLALRSVGGNRRQAAKMLKIGERTLYRKIKELEI